MLNPPGKWAIRHRRLRSLVVAALCVLSLTACSTNTGNGATNPTSGFPLTVENCGQQVMIEKPPDRVVLIYRYAAPLVEAVGALNKVIAKAGDYPAELYPEQARSTLEKIPTIGDAETSDGSVQVGLESVIAQRPDVVLGSLEGTGITRETLGQSGIPFIDTYVTSCQNLSPQYKNPTFDAVYDQVEFYGQIFNHQQEAATAVVRLRERVATVRAATTRGTAPRTAAAVFVPVGGGQLYTYGTQSMVHAQLTTVGLTNVYGDVDKRDIETSFEEILGRNPDVLIVLTVANLQAARDTLLSLPGAQTLAAVRNNRILVMKFDYMDPPTPLSIEGLEKVAEAFWSLK